MKTTTRTEAAPKNYAGPNLWGVKFVRVAGEGAGILNEVSCDWKRRERWCSVELNDGRTVTVEAARIEVIA